MTKRHLIRHDGGYFCVREDYLGITNGNSCQAKILEIMEFWTVCRDNEIKRVKSYNKQAAKNNIPLAPEPDYWLYESIEDFRIGIYKEHGATHIKQSLQSLSDKGFIEIKPSSNKFDKTRLYKLNVALVQDSIDSWSKLRRLAKPDKSKMTLDKSKMTLDKSKMTLDKPDLSLDKSGIILDESEMTLEESNLASDLYISNSLIKQSLSNTPPKPGDPTQSACVDKKPDLFHRLSQETLEDKEQALGRDFDPHEKSIFQNLETHTSANLFFQEIQDDSLENQDKKETGAASFDNLEQSNNRTIEQKTVTTTDKKKGFSSIEELLEIVLADPSILTDDPLPSVYRSEIRSRGWKFPWRTQTRDKIYQTCDRRMVEYIAKERAKWDKLQQWQEKIPTVIKSIANMESTKRGLEELLSYWHFAIAANEQQQQMQQQIEEAKNSGGLLTTAPQIKTVKRFKA